jgi:hypothetical protein
MMENTQPTRLEIVQMLRREFRPVCAQMRDVNAPGAILDLLDQVEQLMGVWEEQVDG